MLEMRETHDLRVDFLACVKKLAAVNAIAAACVALIEHLISALDILDKILTYVKCNLSAPPTLLLPMYKLVLYMRNQLLLQDLQSKPHNSASDSSLSAQELTIMDWTRNGHCDYSVNGYIFAGGDYTIVQLKHWLRRCGIVNPLVVQHILDHANQAGWYRIYSQTQAALYNASQILFFEGMETAKPGWLSTQSWLGWGLRQLHHIAPYHIPAILDPNKRYVLIQTINEQQLAVTIRMDYPQILQGTKYMLQTPIRITTTFEINIRHDKSVTLNNLKQNFENLQPLSLKQDVAMILAEQFIINAKEKEDVQIDPVTSLTSQLTKQLSIT